MKTKILIICGPTAAGKTAVGIELAKRLHGEIVSADSQQVWQHFDIGTAKPTLEERALVPHHLIDIVEPIERFDAARFVELADAAIADIAARGKLPIVVGGTGMYLRMLVHGICNTPPRDPEYRAALEQEIERGGLASLYARLSQIDPASAHTIQPGDTTRIVRALEIQHVTGISASELRAQHAFQEDRYAARWIGVTLDRAELYARINARVDQMMARGLLEEAKALRECYGDGVQPFAAVGYKEMASFLRGEIQLDEAVERIKRNTRHYAKRQLTWFRAEPGIEWTPPQKWQ